MSRHCDTTVYIHSTGCILVGALTNQIACRIVITLSSALKVDSSLRWSISLCALYNERNSETSKYKCSLADLLSSILGHNNRLVLEHDHM